ncbi:MAG TPA: dienelactone hydrolase family protein [Acidobacteriota bacterium]|jgi:dienelactone hydrolase|nr:dienelactone hydrolase family protein [Acidobacteriota bacterium]
MAAILAQSVTVTSGEVHLEGEMNLPAGASGIVLFAHGSGSSRHSPRNKYVAQIIQQAGLGTLLFDLLTRQEEAIDLRTAHLRFNIDLLANRLVDATRWFRANEEIGHLNVGYFGSSTGGGAALVAAAALQNEIRAVVSRGGRPDLAGQALPQVKCPTLLIVGGHDEPVIRLNREAYARLECKKELKIVPGATHLFEEPGKLQQVAELAAGWFKKYLAPAEPHDERNYV